MNPAFPLGTRFATVSTLKEQCSTAYQNALAEARRNIGRGFFRSRGKSVRGVDARGEIVFGEADSVIWDGSAKDLNRVIRLAIDAGAVNVSIDGGVDYSDYFAGFDDGNYDAWVTDWSVDVYSRP